MKSTMLPISLKNAVRSANCSVVPRIQSNEGFLKAFFLPVLHQMVELSGVESNVPCVPASDLSDPTWDKILNAQR